MLIIELGLALIVLVLAFLGWRVGSSFFEKIEHGLAWLADRPRLAVFAVGISVLSLRTAVLPILPIPYPGLQDEFSYQLMADTFAHGRLTNPTHPMWVHFESVFVIHRPTYCSMYYPAHGMLMAIGQVVAGHPFWGVWLSVGLMCAAICWMLQAWVPPFWALVGGLLAVIRIGAFSYWANSYWGGSVTALGGALVLGALPRIKRHPRIADALLMGVGFALLADSRPYESLFFSLPILGALAVWIWQHFGQEPRKLLLRLVLPLAVVLAMAGAFTLYYFWRTTGNPLLPPYIVNLRTYAVNPNFAWLPLRPVPQYHNEMIRRHWTGWDVDQYMAIRAHPVVSTVVKLLMVWFFYLGPLLSIPFLALGFALPFSTSWKDVTPKLRFLILVCAANLLAYLLAVPTNPHYAAPITAVVYALLMMAFARIRHWRTNNKPTGLLLIRGVLTTAVVLLALRIAIPLLRLPINSPSVPWTWASPWNQMLPRADIERKLRLVPGEHLVIVHYGPQHNPREGWVSNGADIDTARIVWAQDMGQEKNEELIHYFAGRQVWILEPDQNPIRLLPHRTDRSITTSVNLINNNLSAITSGKVGHALD